MPQVTMEGEVAVAVLEENPWSFQQGYDTYLCQARIHMALVSAARDGILSLIKPIFFFSKRIKIISSLLASVKLSITYNIILKDYGEVEFTIITASKGGFDIKIGSHTLHMPKNASACHPLVYMMLFARNLFDDIFACRKSMVPRSILDMIRRSPSVYTGIARETPVECIGLYAESGLGCTAISSAKTQAIAAEEDEDAAYHYDAMGGADTLPCMESIATGLAPAASLHKENKLSIFPGTNGSGNYTGYMEHVGDVTHTNPEHHSIMEAAEEKPAATWVVATAAAHHATGNRDLLSDFAPDQPGRFVESADGAAPMRVLGRGSVITDTVVLHNVLYVPGLTANLVSASQLAELDYTVRFSRGACHIRSAAAGTIVGKASVGGDGLFQLDFLKVMTSITGELFE